MRLRVTVRRNGIPDFPLVWAVDTASSPTIYQLLEQINEVAPVADDDQWGLEDYAVEIRGSNGVNYECLHYQLVQSVMKDEDEVIIRPLLHQDLRARDISGRHQISTDGRHIYDGLPLGRPKLKRIMNRPAIKIQPRKRQKLLNNEEADDEEPKPLEDTPEDESHAEKNQQLILHNDFEDTDSEDEDFAPEEDEDSQEEESEEDIESEKDINTEAEMNQEIAEQSDEEDSQETESIEPTLADVPNPALRAMIRKLHSAFPISPLGVCKFILQGTKGDMGEAYEALNRGFVPIKPKSAITETSEEQDNLPTNTPSEEAPSKPEEPENEDSMQVEADLTADSLLEYYDQNGLPPGSIKSGKALKFMADAIKSSPVPAPPPRPESRPFISAMKRKRKPFTQDEGLAHGLPSTPAIDMESQDVEASSETSSDSSSSEEDEEDEESSESDSDGSSGDTSSDDSSDDDEKVETADHPPKDFDVHMNEHSSSSDEESNDDSSSDGDAPREVDVEMDETSSSSDSESSSDSSSDDEAPEESSSRLNTSTTTTTRMDATSSPSNKPITNQKKIQGAPPGKGKNATRARNKRRQHGNAFQRFQKKGILPAGTTIAEFCKMELKEDTSPEEALTKLEQVRAAKSSAEPSNHEFERKRKELLDSIASGGVEVGSQVARAISRSPSVSAQPGHIQTGDGVPDLQSLPVALSVPSKAIEATKAPQVAQSENTDIEIPRPSTAPEVPELETPMSSHVPQPASTEPSQKDIARPRRSRLDMGAGKRLLFGALGIRTPKTKADEEKVKNDLMKFARPLTTAKPVEEESITKPIEEEDPEAWREKINYRAVECVQEGIELSEPPFPFVQRWDPQQQSSWPQKGNRGGKRKQAQRDQEQYYDDTRTSKKQKQRKGKHSYAEEQEYLEASYEPSYQDDIMELQYDDTTQLEISPNDVNDEVSQQLMQDIQAPQAAASLSPEDLASLPEDPSSLPDLQDGQAKIGMTIAFRSLECSSATNWAPRISGYRTAIVIAFGENGLLQLSLAMRDRHQSQKRYDKITGERIYDKFEVPDDEEMEDEDDGMLDLPFYDMFEPKIVQQPPPNLSTGETQLNEVLEDDPYDKVISNEESQPKDGDRSEASKILSHEEEQAEAQLSHVTETPIHSDAPDVESEDEVVPEEGSVLENQPDILEKALEQISTVDITRPQNKVLPITPTRKISDENREKINTLMKDAGFRSSIASSVLREIRPDDLQSTGDASDFEKLKKDMSTPADLEKVYSPKFHGFGSSSPASKQRDNSRSPTKLASSLPPGTQNQWETISEYGKRSPELAEGEEQSVVAEETSSWITEAHSACPSSPPAKRTIEPTIERQVPPGPLDLDLASYNEATSLSGKRKSEERSTSQMTDPDTDATRNSCKTKRKKKRKHASPSKALDLWQQFEPIEVKTSPETAQSSKESPAPALGLDGTADANSNTSIQYPKLSIDSSFTSQVTDVGRQPEPDFNFDESTILVGDDNPNVSDMEMDAPSLDTSDLDKSWKGVCSEEREVADNSNEDGSFINLDSKSTPYKSINRTTKVSKTVPNISEDEPSSDDSVPSLEVLSQQRTIKHEKLTSPKSNNISKNGSDQKKPKSITINDDSDDSTQSTPKASQRHRQLSEARSSKSRSSGNFSSQPRGSVPSASQPLPSQSNQQSIVIDLCDSDSEPEAGEESDDIQPARFKTYNKRSDDEDYEVEDSPGWGTKKQNNLGGVETRRHTGVGLKDSSEKTVNRRKTVSR